MIRRMEPGDIEEVGRIWLAASTQAHDFVPAEFWRADLPTMTGEILPHPRTEAYVFEGKDGLDGFISLGGTHVGCLFVRPGRQGRGIGAALLRHAQSLHPELDLTVYRRNVRATRFYEREGFRITGERTCPHTGCAEHTMVWRREGGPGEGGAHAVERVDALPVAEMEPLLRAAEAEAFRAVRVLVEEWTAGANRFDRPGEALFAARGGDGRLLGVCGLNRDPLRPRAGRVRRLFVLPGFRRRGIGRALVARVEAAAAPHFAELVLRTFDPAAAAFYQTLGFRAEAGEGHTHRRVLGPAGER